MDKNTYCNNTLWLLCYIKYEFWDKINEDILYYHSLIQDTVEEIYDNVNIIVISNEIKSSNCVGISIDGSRVILGKPTGLLIRERANAFHLGDTIVLFTEHL